MLAISLKSPTLPFICSWVTFMHILHAHSPKLTTGKKILKLGVFGLYQAMPLICSRICDSFPGHCHWQLVAKSNKMFNKPHVLSFLALPLYPCGCEPETEPRLPPLRCNFACVLCVHMCSQFHIFLSCSRVSWRNVLSWTEQLGTEFWKGKKNSLGFFLCGRWGCFILGPFIQGERRWAVLVNEGHKYQCPSSSWSEREDSLLCHLISASSVVLP